MTSVKTDGIHRAANISEDGAYRYSLLRSWYARAGEAKVLRWVMLNPSTASAEIDDPTIRKCMHFTRANGYNAMLVHNLYALRATNPERLLRHEDPIGPDNRRTLAGWTMPTICAWGTKAYNLGFGGWIDEVVRSIRADAEGVYVLGLTRDGYPKHPLYLRNDTALVTW